METNPHAGDKQFVGTQKNTAPTTPGTPLPFPTFKFQLSLSGKKIGWLGKSGYENRWACIVPEENDAVIMGWYQWPPDNRDPSYLRIKGDEFMTWSTLPGDPVAFNVWDYANRWGMIPGDGVNAKVIAFDSKAPLSQYKDEKWIYANMGYKQLQIDMITA
jgi:hypothetical protein